VAQPLSRRDRVRAATVTEIKGTARRILVTEGVDGLSLRAIAREMGMTAPALYRYFPSREDLVVHLIADLYDELAGTMAAARDAQAPADTPGRLRAACRAFRHWAVGHPREFALLFGSPIPGLEAGRHGGEVTVAHEAGDRFGAIFAELVGGIYVARPFPVPAEEDIDPLLRQELTEWCTSFPAPLPVGVAQVFLSCWIRLYGMVAMEVFGHLKFAVADAEPVFEAELRDLAGKLGVEADYRPPAAG
jgi:AcrR family transcriptional regulator